MPAGVQRRGPNAWLGCLEPSLPEARLFRRGRSEHLLSRICKGQRRWENLDKCTGKGIGGSRNLDMTLTDPDDSNEAAGVMLLADIKKLFDERQTDRVASAELEKALGEMEHRPWPEWKHGKPITVRQLARLLNPFGIRPKTIRIEDATPKGYERDSFTDAFSRYLPPNPSATAQQTSDDTRFGYSQTATDQPNVADEESAEPLLDEACCGVADRKANGAGLEPFSQVQGKI